MMSTVQCPGCGKNIVACRRYPLEPLAEFMRTTIPAACRAMAISGSSENDARCHGITRRLVDRIAAELREHPAVIWPEVVDHDIEDHAVECAEPTCDNRFIPRTHPGGREHLFCSRNCAARKWMRDTYHQRGDAEQRRARYQSDPEYRDRRIREARWYRRQRREAA